MYVNENVFLCTRATRVTLKTISPTLNLLHLSRPMVAVVSFYILDIRYHLDSQRLARDPLRSRPDRLNKNENKILVLITSHQSLMINCQMKYKVLSVNKLMRIFCCLCI